MDERENEWQRQATAAAIAAARKIAVGSGPLMHVPVGQLSDLQWGWLIAAALFSWVQARCEQAITEGLEPDEAVQTLALSPSPTEAAVVRSILQALADQAQIDWSQPLAAWSEDQMVGFLILARQLLERAQHALEQTPSKILQKSIPSEELNDPVPFRFVLTLQLRTGVDPIRSLRWALKQLLRQHGLRCVDLRHERAW